MKSRILVCITAIGLFVALSISAKPTAQHRRYRVIDTGTLGGPNSSLGFEGERDMNNNGTLVSLVDLSTFSTPPFCFSAGSNECHVGHTAEWKNGALTDLGALGLGGSGPIWITDSGLISGLSQNGVIDPLTGSPEFRAAFWRAGRIIDLGTLGGNESVSGGLNDRGQVVGCATNTVPDPFLLCVGAPQQSRAFMWQDGVMQDLGTLGGPDAVATVVNARGQVAGFSFTDAAVNPATGIPTQHPFLWQNGEMQDLGTIGGTFVFSVNDINDRGEIIGAMSTSGDQSIHPFLWDGRILQDLGTLGGDFASANEINPLGEVVGISTNLNNQANFAFLWKNGTMTNLGVVEGDVCSAAMAINSKEQIVGGSDDCMGNNANAFLWEQGSVINLNAFVAPGSAVQLTIGLSINESGQIAAQGTLSNGDIHAFVLIPCGESAEGCRDAAETPMAQNNSIRVSDSLPMAPRVSPGSAWRVEVAHRYHIPGLGAQRN